jgi:branched-chain amino acid transport system permease protein
LLRRLYRRSHLSQVLATFAVILIANEIVRMIWGSQPILLNMPPALSGPVELWRLRYPAYRLVVIGVGLASAVLLYLLVTRTRAGMWVRAGASDREMAEVMGVDTRTLFTLVFAIGAALCAVAGALLGPLLAVQVGMGENILILAFVVITIGGIGSIRGALVGSLLVGLVDTARPRLPAVPVPQAVPRRVAAEAGPAVASMLIYMLMAAVLYFRPTGLFPARADAGHALHPAASLADARGRRGAGRAAAPGDGDRSRSTWCSPRAC